MGTMSTARTAHRPDTAETAECLCIQDVAISVPDVAALLNCSPEYLYAGLRSSRFPGAQVGRSWKMPRAFVHGFVRDVLSVGRPVRFEDYAAAWLAKSLTEAVA